MIQITTQTRVRSSRKVTDPMSTESHRYHYFELWNYRVRLMETDFFAPMLVPPFHIYTF